jgi:hypothetical protein
MNRLTSDTRLHLSLFGESTREMLTVDHMDRPEKGTGSATKHLQDNRMQPEIRPRPSPQMALFGESTSNLLQFQEVVNNPVKETRRPKVRMHRSMESAESRKPRQARSGAGGAPKDIFVPPMARVVHKSQSLPPVLPPKPVEKDWPRVYIDVAPGFSAQLCGTEESLDALKKKLVAQTDCTNCETFLYCINTADMVLCPVCRSISPVDGESDNPIYEKLGLGLTIDFVMENVNMEESTQLTM